MATVQFKGAVLQATPVRQLANGDWIMEAHGQGPRFDDGDHFVVKPNEIVAMDASELPMSASTSAPNAVGPTLANPILPDALTVPQINPQFFSAPPPPPPSILVLTPTPQDFGHMTKLTALADLAAATTKDIESEVDRAHSRMLAAKEKAFGSIAKMDGVSAEIEKGVKAVEDLANQLSNNPPSAGQ